MTKHFSSSLPHILKRNPAIDYMTFNLIPSKFPNKREKVPPPIFLSVICPYCAQKVEQHLLFTNKIIWCIILKLGLTDNFRINTV
jgi:hypothetical protein